MDETRTLTLQFNGREVKAAPLKESQLFILSMMADGKITPADLHRICRIVEWSVGPEEWARIDEEMLIGAISIKTFIEFLPELVNAHEDDIDAELKKAEAKLAELKKQRESGE